MCSHLEVILKKLRISGVYEFTNEIQGWFSNRVYVKFLIGLTQSVFNFVMTFFVIVITLNTKQKHPHTVLITL